MDEKTKMITTVRAMMRKNPNVTAAEVKKAIGGNRPVAFFSILLQEAREAEEEVAEQLAGEDAEAAKTPAVRECWLVKEDGQAIEIKWEKNKGNRSYFRPVVRK